MSSIGPVPPPWMFRVLEEEERGKRIVLDGEARLSVSRESVRSCESEVEEVEVEKVRTRLERREERNG
jgi:hypothetical protein